MQSLLLSTTQENATCNQLNRLACRHCSRIAYMSASNVAEASTWAACVIPDLPGFSSISLVAACIDLCTA